MSRPTPRHAARVARRRPGRGTSLALVAALAAVGVVAVPQTASAASRTVSGVVFRDVDSDGIRDAAETGFGGVTVTVTGAAGTAATATSAADGSWAATVDTDATGDDLRVEFALTAAQTAEGWRHSFAAPAGAGVRSGSSVQFVDVSAGSATAHFGVNHPEDYNVGSADILIPVHNPGDPLLSSNTSERGLVQHPWTASGQDRALQTQISSTNGGSFGVKQGTVWGNAYDRVNGISYTAAFLRRFGGLGSGGLGALYSTDVSAKQTTLWIDLAAAGIDVGTSQLVAATGAAGSSASQINSARGLLANPSTPIRDEKVFGIVGRVGLGAAVVDVAGKNVYVTNLHNRTVVHIPVNADGTAGTPTEIALPLAAGEVPFGLHLSRGRLLVGTTTTASGLGDSDATAAAGRAALSARVLSASATGAATTGFASVLDVTDLTFRRGPVDASYAVNSGNAGLTAAKIDRGTHWNAWTDSWSTVRSNCLNSSNASETTPKFCGFPQPVLSSIDVDTDGNLLLGWADRFGWQSGDGQYAAATAGTEIFFNFAGGDVQIAGLQPGGTYALESAGQITSVTGNRNATWTDINPNTGANTPGNGGMTNGNGPGGGEFFYDRNRPSSSGSNTATHYESTTGALAALAGVDQLAVTAYSTQGSQNGQFYGSGPKWLSTTTGESARAYDIVRQSDLGSSFPNYRAFGKSGGLGDLQLLVDAAPVQIGNYVWFDIDADGVQDPAETPMAGITVQLLKDGVVIGTTTTDAAGQYLFSSDDPAITGLEPFGGEYEVIFVKPTTGSVSVAGVGTVLWSDVRFTQANAGGSTSVDSNADSFGSATVTVGGPGENDHTIDAGFVVGRGGFSVTKDVTGTGGAPASKQFVVNLTYSPAVAGKPSQITVLDGQTVTVDDLPAGTVVTLTEVDPTDPGAPSTGWSAAVWSGTGVTSTATGATLTIGADTTVAATLENPSTLLTGGFTLAKAVNGPAAGDVPTSTPFTVDLTYAPAVTGAPASVVVTPGTSVPVTGIPRGTVVTLSETLPADGTPNPVVGWSSATWTGTGLTAGPNGTATFTVGSGTPTLTVTNETERLEGTFTLTKSVTGGAAALVPAATTFTVNAAYSPAVATAPASITVVNGVAALPVTVPAGTQVTLTEVLPADGTPHAGVDWGTPQWTGGGSAGSGASYTFTVTDGDAISIGLTNPTTLLTGSIEVTKSVTGAAADRVDASQPFDIVATWTNPLTGVPATQTLTVTKSSPVATLADLPRGTVVTLTETTPVGAPPSVGWSTPVWTGTGVTDNGDGSATLTVGAGTAAVGLENPTTLVTNGFTLSKLVTGDGATTVPSGTSFDVDVTYAPAWAAGPTTLSVTSSTPVTVTGVPSGTVVTLTEATRPTVPGVTWGTPTWSGGTPTTGSTTSFTVDAAPVAVVLTNPASQQRGSVTVAKTLTGGAAGAVTTWTAVFDVTVGGVPRTVTLDESTTSETIADLPYGTVVTVAERSFTSTPATTGWAGVTWQLDGSAVTPGPAGVSVTVGDGTSASIVARNRVERPAVTIEKGDGTGTTITHDADTMDDAATYTPGETRDIVFTPRNSGTEDLRDVVVTDATLAGAIVDDMWCTFPGETTRTAGVLAGSTWTVTWAASTGTNPSLWASGDTFTCGASLTVVSAGGVHVDNATVTGVGAGTGRTVTDSDPYNAFTAGIQIIKYDGERTDPSVTGPAGWVTPAKPLTNTAQDANTAADGVLYPEGTAQSVRWVVTNTGPTYLTDVLVSDTTTRGPDIGAWTCDLSPVGGPSAYSFTTSGAWAGPLAPGASFFCEGPLTLPSNTQHADTADVVGTVVVPEVDPAGLPTGGYVTDGSGDPVAALDPSGDPWTLTDDDPFHAYTFPTPDVAILKGDGTGTTITHEADTMAAGAQYEVGETRTIVFRPRNTGQEALTGVTVTDETVAGGRVTDMACTFPGESSATAGSLVGGAWLVRWAASFGATPSAWPVGDTFVCTASLTVTSAQGVHVDRATVTGTGAVSGVTVDDVNAYNAFTGDIQVIKYDGERPDPAVRDGAAWVVPGKPLADRGQDANTPATAVDYVARAPRTVRWVVTNTGPTTLTNVTLVDRTADGPAVGSWTCDLAPVGGPASYDFATPWTGAFAPGQSFFCEGPLTLPADDTHGDVVKVTGQVVVPEVDTAGVPTGQPSRTPGGDLVVARDDAGQPWTVDDDDPFHARTPADPTPDVAIVKGDTGTGEGTTVVNDANTMTDGVLYAPGESRTIAFRPTNTGTEELRDVVVTDRTVAGGAVTAMACTFPGETAPTAGTLAAGTWTVTWAASTTGGTSSSGATWKPGTGFDCTATLTITTADGVHVDRATVSGTGVVTGRDVSDTDPYHAFTAAIQVIKYDGHSADPVVRDGDDWVVPTKPLVDAAQDANTKRDAVRADAESRRRVRWVVTNTGPTWLTDVKVSDRTITGPAISAWSCDLSPVGGPSSWSFDSDGAWAGPFEPGASFFCEGVLPLGSNAYHADEVTVTSHVIVPEVDSDGVPTGKPALDEDGTPVVAAGPDGTPVVLTDDDPYHVVTPITGLPVTGAELQRAAIVALVLLLLGGAALLVSRRRQARG